MRNDEGALHRRPRQHSESLALESSTQGGRRSVPQVVVVFELECVPHVYACWNTDEDDARLTAWFDAKPDYAELLHRAVELSGQAA